MWKMRKIQCEGVVVYLVLTLIKVTSTSLLEPQPCGTYHLDKGEMLAIRGSNTSCLWIFKGPTGTKVEAVCLNINIPRSRRCTGASLAIATLPGFREKRWCGRATRRHITRRATTLALRNRVRNGATNRFACNVFLTYPSNTTTSHCKCGEESPPGDRIVGGEEAGAGVYGWVAGVRYKGIKNVFCMAFVVTDRHVITAAHCVDKKKLGRLTVVVSDYTLSIATEMGTAKRLIARAYYPPNHKPGRANFGDLAILVLDHPLPLRSASVTTVCLPPAEDPPSYAAEIGTVLGWGTTNPSSNQRPQHLQKVEVPIWDNSRCTNGTGYKGIINPSLLCAGKDEGGKDACKGDSGSSLTVKSPETGRHTAVGSVSFGFYCALPYRPGVYTRISYYRSWIEKKILSGLRCSDH